MKYKLSSMTAVSISVVVLLSGCGKKSMPTSPDRWAPKLSEVIAVDRTHVDCVFSEPINPSSITANTKFLITDTSGVDSLKIITVVPGTDGVTAHISTFPMDSIEYYLFCDSIQDEAGNFINPSRIQFTGSLQRDTTNPYLVSRSSSWIRISEKLDSILTLKFSEPMDSLSWYWLILPRSNYPVEGIFDSTYTTFRLNLLTAAESLTQAGVYHLYTWGFHDIQGNSAKGFNRLSIYNPGYDLIENTMVSWNDTFDSMLIFITDSLNQVRFFDMITKSDSTINLLDPSLYNFYLVAGKYPSYWGWGKSTEFIEEDSSIVEVKPEPAPLPLSVELILENLE
ncbi:MAG: hypothetical protein APR63_01405 [Desulfuromonas sp. SDB]|nr:MAG: hypothetical protein APR63_01405 [Desulfuromonas sp. SDB]